MFILHLKYLQYLFILRFQQVAHIGRERGHSWLSSRTVLPNAHSREISETTLKYGNGSTWVGLCIPTCSGMTINRSESYDPICHLRTGSPWFDVLASFIAFICALAALPAADFSYSSCLLCAAPAALARASWDSSRSASARRSCSAACADPKHGHCPIRLPLLVAGRLHWALASDLVIARLFLLSRLLLGIYESAGG